MPAHTICTCSLLCVFLSIVICSFPGPSLTPTHSTPVMELVYPEPNSRVRSPHVSAVASEELEKEDRAPATSPGEIEPNKAGSDGRIILPDNIAGTITEQQRAALQKAYNRLLRTRAAALAHHDAIDAARAKHRASLANATDPFASYMEPFTTSRHVVRRTIAFIELGVENIHRIRLQTEDMTFRRRYRVRGALADTVWAIAELLQNEDSSGCWAEYLIVALAVAIVASVVASQFFQSRELMEKL